MEGIGQIEARRAGSSGALDAPYEGLTRTLPTPAFAPLAGEPGGTGTARGSGLLPEFVSLPIRGKSAPVDVSAEPRLPDLPALEAALLEGAAAADALRSMAAGEVRLLGFVEAADFADRVEEISRSLEYVQIVAAQAVERARSEAQHAGPGSSAAAPAAAEWRTGWTDPVPGTNTASVSTAEALSVSGTALSSVAARSVTPQHSPPVGHPSLARHFPRVARHCPPVMR